MSGIFYGGQSPQNYLGGWSSPLLHAHVIFISNLIAFFVGPQKLIILALSTVLNTRYSTNYLDMQTRVAILKKLLINNLR